MKKIIQGFLILFLIYHNFEGYSQVVKENNFVKFTLPDYRLFRKKLILGDSLIVNQKKMIEIQDKRLEEKDSTISLLKTRNTKSLELIKEKNSVISEKDLIINNLDSQMYKLQKNSDKIKYFGFGGTVIGFVLGVLLTR